MAKLRICFDIKLIFKLRNTNFWAAFTLLMHGCRALITVSLNKDIYSLIEDQPLKLNIICICNEKIVDIFGPNCFCYIVSLLSIIGTQKMNMPAPQRMVLVIRLGRLLEYQLIVSKYRKLRSYSIYIYNVCMSILVY